ncbi:MAG: enoyl-CoA hydratase-related protein [Bacteroidales bacterium]|nr:enoyl-CoA hydratase-related protein [Bacteroidales bacterium]
MDYQFLKISQPMPQVESVTISAPKSLNALNLDILKELMHYVDHIDNTLRVIIITGDGNKSFVAGADIAQMQNFNEAEALSFSQYGAEVFLKIENLPMPVIAAVNGFALGGGCELCMACDIRIASENALFGQPEVKLGIIPGFSGTYRLSKLVGQGFAKELIYTGRNIKADAALKIGLVNAVVPQDELMIYVLKIAGQIVANAPIAVNTAKQVINDNYDLSREDALALENKQFAACFNSEDQKEGMTAFLNKRPATFKNK